MPRKAKANTQSGKTKDEKFDFNEEIVIGLKRIDDGKNKKVNQKRNEKLANTHKQKKKQTANKNRKHYRQKVKDELVINDIYSKQTEENKQEKQKENEKTNKSKNKVKNQKTKKKTTKPTKKLTPKQELARKKRKAIFKLLRWTGLIVVIIAGIIYTLLSPIFNIKNINIYGNSKISNDEIISLSQIKVDQNTFKYKKSEIISNIKQNAYIEDITVKRKLPDTIELLVTERKATYMIQVGNAYAYINNQGYVLEITDQKENIPIISGNETLQEEIHLGERLCEADLIKLSDVNKIMESASSNDIVDLITTINIKDSDNYMLYLDTMKKIVHLGDTSNLSTKMLWIIKFNQEEKKNEGQIFLNMNLNNENNKPYFRRKV